MSIDGDLKQVSIRRTSRKLACWSLFFLLLGSPIPTIFAQVPGITVLGTDLDEVTDIASAGDERLFVTGRAGGIKILRPNGEVADEPFLDITKKVVSGATVERGLLSLVFHPKYAENGYFYVVYSALDGATILARYSVSEDPDIADPESEEIILRIEQPTTKHQSGDLNFGPDGFLYVTIGDGGTAGDATNPALDKGSLLGKVLRIDVDGDLPYSVPESNPFVNDSDGLDEIWALGFRNAWRFSFDRLSGDMYFADVGVRSREEISFMKAGVQPGHNFGWSCFEGTLGRRAVINALPSICRGDLKFPIHDYSHDPGCAVIGGYVYRGNKFPSKAGYYFFADFCLGQLWSLSENENGQLGLVSYGTPFSRSAISTFGEDVNGELYVGDRANGVVYKLAVGELVPQADPVTVAARVTAMKSGNGNGTITSRTFVGIDCGTTCWNKFPLGQTITLRATADSRSMFEGWSGDCDESGTILIDDSKNCTARFTLKEVLFNLDVDANGVTDALTDGILVLRFLFGFNGEALTREAVASDCSRCSAEEIAAFLKDLTLDVDDNGVVDALTDGILVLRFLFGFAGESLIKDAVAQGCANCTSQEVEAFLQTLMP